MLLKIWTYATHWAKQVMIIVGFFFSVLLGVSMLSNMPFTIQVGDYIHTFDLGKSVGIALMFWVFITIAGLLGEVGLPILKKMRGFMKSFTKGC